MLCTKFKTDKVFNKLSIINLLIKMFPYSSRINPRLSMISNKYTGPGKLNIEVLTEANVRILFWTHKSALRIFFFFF